MKFKIPITKVSLEAEIHQSFYQVVLDVHVDASPQGMADVMTLQKHIKEDLGGDIIHVMTSVPWSMVGRGMGCNISTVTMVEFLMKFTPGSRFEHFNQVIDHLGTVLKSGFLARTQVSRYWDNPPPVYSYEPTMVQCDECHDEFIHTELKKESGLWGEGDYEKAVESDTVCPKCGAWDCCELEFESVDKR